MFNVITAYSVQESLDTLARFSKVDAFVLHSSICDDGECEEVMHHMKESNPTMLVIALSPTGGNHTGADYNISSHEPRELRSLLRSHFGDPRTAQVQPREPPRA